MNEFIVHFKNIRIFFKNTCIFNFNNFFNRNRFSKTSNMQMHNSLAYSAKKFLGYALKTTHIVNYFVTITKT